MGTRQTLAKHAGKRSSGPFGRRLWNCRFKVSAPLRSALNVRPLDAQRPVRAALGHSYNGYYSRLLIRQIRVRSPLRFGRRKTEVHWTSCAPDGPLKRIWLHSLAGQDAVLAYRLGRCSCFAGCATGTPQPFKSEIWVQAPLELFHRPIY